MKKDISEADYYPLLIYIIWGKEAGNYTRRRAIEIVYDVKLPALKFVAKLKGIYKFLKGLV